MRVLIAAMLLVFSSSCGPAGSGEREAPPYLGVSPAALDFGSEGSAHFIEVSNEGGGEIAYSVKVSAAADGVTWLQADPQTGTVGAGTSRSVMLVVANINLLAPGVHTGEVTVEAAGQDSHSVNVTLEVGQPVLRVEPADSLAFGATSDTRTLVVKNSGKGRLKYSVHLPGKWILQEPELLEDLGPDDSQSVTFTVNRELVPWYGEGEDILVVASNGLNEGVESGTATLTVQVAVDASCVQDADCTRDGYYCGIQGDGGTCVKRKSNGASCMTAGECGSSECVDGVCCEDACSGQCTSCALPGLEGKCTPMTGDVPCEDGLACTVGDNCVDGTCVGGELPDCSDLDNPCEQAVCLEEEGGCVAVEPTDRCLIEGTCYDSGAPHETLTCLVCLPEFDRYEWSIGDGFCFLGGQCYPDGAAVAGDCQVCNSDNPEVFTSAPNNTPCGSTENPCSKGACDGGVCVMTPENDKFCDDGNSCTKMDSCQEGSCVGQPYDCDDSLSCTVDACNGDGTCTFDLIDDFCLIDGQCVAIDEQEPGSQGCRRCTPALATDAWSAVANDSPCDDDQLSCTDDLCSSGVCLHSLSAGQCLIDGACRSSGSTHPTNLCLACVPEQSNSQWTPHNDGMPCDDGLWCVVDEKCEGGACDGVARDCGGDDCNTEWCIEDQQLCVAAPKGNGLQCDDGDACTVNETCFAGLCSGDPKDCSGVALDNPCFDGECISDDPVEPGKCVPIQRGEGAECDDGVACTTSTTCTAAGGCVGTALTSMLCAEQLGLDDPCLVAACQEPDGCVSLPVVDGTPCELANALAQCQSGACTFIQCEDPVYADCNDDPTDGCEVGLFEDLQNCGECGSRCLLDNAWTQCLAGQCNLVACKDGYTDCDLELGNGCESATATDPSNCGQCGLVCHSPNPAKTGVCAEGNCTLQACETDWWNLDGDPANGCECIEGGVELCNDTDDDCDGIVDEGFDLMSDLDNCGACGEVCAVDGVESFDCVGGQCIITKCPEGVVDRNGLTGDGCEFELFAVAELWVDALNGGFPGADGSEEHPFATIQEALVDLEPSTRIHVMAGTYLGPVHIDVVGTVLVGEDSAVVTISGTNGAPVVSVTANEVVIRELTISGGNPGVLIEGSPIQAVNTAIVSDVVVTNQAATETPLEQSDLEANGIFARYVEDLAVLSSTVDTVTGGTMDEAYHGGRAAGVHCFWCENPVIVSSVFQSIFGGDGGLNPWEGSLEGGSAYGIILENTTGGSVIGNAVAHVNAGIGGYGAYKSSGGTGGVGAGLFLTGTTLVSLFGNSVADIEGGAGSMGSTAAYTASNQVAFGFYIEADSLANQIDPGNTFEGEPIVFLYGSNGRTVQNLTLTGSHNPTNWGVVAVFESQNVTLRNLTVADFLGETGSTTRGPESGFAVAGIRLVGCTDCLLEDSTISGIRGGTGGQGGYWTRGGDGGEAVGLLIEECPGTVLSGNRIGEISGGSGQTGGYGAKDHYGSSGAAVGVRIRNSEGLTFSHNRIHHLRRSWGLATATPVTACVEIGGDVPTVVQQLSCYGTGVGSYPNEGVGVRLLADTTAAIQVVNSIFSVTNGYGLVGLASNEGLLSASYSDFHECPLGVVEHATAGAGCFEEDPLFVNPDEGNLTLTVLSPCIDSGLATTDCNEEPVPNGCAVNMGAFGGTSEATSAIDALHCNVCP